MAAKKTTRSSSAAKEPATQQVSRKNSPTPSRPVMPDGYHIPQSIKGSVPWGWAEERLVNSHNYFLTTVRPDGRPHTMIVWCIWLDNACYFSTGATTRKAKNLASNPNCIVCSDKVDEAVILEGQARQLPVSEIPEPAFEIYQKKYGWKLDPEMGPVYKVTARVVFAMPEKLFPDGATRWLFK